MDHLTELRLKVLDRAKRAEGALSVKINDLAGQCDTSPEALTDCLKSLAREGLIDLFRRLDDGETIKLYDPAFFTDADFFGTEFRIRITYEGKLFLEMRARLRHKTG